MPKVHTEATPGSSDQEPRRRRVVIDLGHTQHTYDPDTLFCPFPSAIHPNTDTTHTQTLEWLVRQGLLAPGDTSSRLVSEQYTWLAGRMFPTASEERLQLISDFTSWLFFHDDLCDEGASSADPAAMAAHFDRALALWRGVTDPDPDRPIERGLVDLRARFELLAPDDTWILRYTTRLEEYFEGCLWEVVNRSEQRTPPLQEYVSLRPFTGAVWMYLELLELIMGQRLPFVLRSHLEIHRLRQSTSNLVAWHNDLYSLAKELASGDTHNLVLVLQQEQQLPLPLALERAIEKSNAEVRWFQSVAGSLPRRSGRLGELSDGYVRALELFIRGALDWAQEAQRYRSGPEAR